MKSYLIAFIQTLYYLKCTPGWKSVQASRGRAGVRCARSGPLLKPINTLTSSNENSGFDTTNSSDQNRDFWFLGSCIIKI